MTKFINDAVMDAALDEIALADLQTLCSDPPTTRTEAVTTYALADVAMTPGTDYTKANGDTDGRKVTVAAKSGVTVDATGMATHRALVDATRLLLVTELGTVRQNTAQAGGASTITLDTGASAVDDFYNSMYVTIVSGTGVGQSRKISDYVGSTKVATVSSAWTTQPDSSSVFRIFGQQVTSGNTADFSAFDHEIADVAQG